MGKHAGPEERSKSPEFYGCFETSSLRKKYLLCRLFPTNEQVHIPHSYSVLKHLFIVPATKMEHKVTFLENGLNVSFL
jgi:hypothetical protein